MALKPFFSFSLHSLQRLKPFGVMTVRESFSMKTAALNLPATARQKCPCTPTVFTDLNFSFLMPGRNTQAFVFLRVAGQDMFTIQFSTNAQIEIERSFFR